MKFPDMDYIFRDAQDQMLDHPIAFFSAIVTVFTIGVAYCASLPQDTVYGSFKRMGGTNLQWTPIHEIVQDGYAKVRARSKQNFP
jgi:hypothetical protein